jgi:hypothetical protein
MTCRCKCRKHTVDVARMRKPTSRPLPGQRCKIGDPWDHSACGSDGRAPFTHAAWPLVHWLGTILPATFWCLSD